MLCRALRSIHNQPMASLDDAGKCSPGWPQQNSNQVRRVSIARLSLPTGHPEKENPELGEVLKEHKWDIEARDAMHENNEGDCPTSSISYGQAAKMSCASIINVQH
jgi:hypothetical protein